MENSKEIMKNLLKKCFLPAVLGIFIGEYLIFKTTGSIDTSNIVIVIFSNIFIFTFIYFYLIRSR